MPDLALENVLLANVKAYIIALNTTRFTTRNVIVVPYFEEPPMQWTDLLVELRYPEVYPYGHAGWSYLHRFTFDVAIFKRLAADPHSQYEAVLTALAEDNLILRQRLNNYNGGVGSGSGATLPLAIHLFDSHQVMSPRVLAGEKKTCMWTSFRMWGLAGTSVDLFKNPA